MELYLGEVGSVKQYNEPIQVEVGDDGLPCSFRWRNRVWRVLEVVDRWVLCEGVENSVDAGRG